MTDSAVPGTPRPLPFRDRADAGQALGAVLAGRWAGEDVRVLALPRGGVPVAAPVAAALGAPLDVLVVRKLGVPRHPELAMGAIALGGVRVLNDHVMRSMGVTADELADVTASEEQELRRRERDYRGDRPQAHLSGATVVLVDDGLATGATMRAAVDAVRTKDPRRIVVAVPVGAPESCAALADTADDVVCVHSPADFRAVGACYRDFGQTSDDEVRRLLARRTPELVVMVGLQGCGKSTWVQQHLAATHAVVSKDHWPNGRRKQARQSRLVAEHLAAGRDVVVDNTNPSLEERAALVQLARSAGARVRAVWLDVPLQTCLDRNDGREGRARVPLTGIRAASKRFTAPTTAEGFDRVDVVRG